MADWSRVQGTTSQSPAGNTLTLSFAATVTSGNVVCGGVLLNTGYTVTLTDDKSNTYTVFDEHDDGTLYTAAFKSAGFLTNTPKTLTYTAHGPATTGNFWVDQTEFSPPTGATSFTTDVSVTQFNSAGTSWPAMTTTGSDELVYAVSFSSGTSTVGTGFTTSNGSGTAVFSEYQIKAAAGSVTAVLATQTGSFWGPAFALNGGGATVHQIINEINQSLKRASYW